MGTDQPGLFCLWLSVCYVLIYDFVHEKVLSNFKVEMPPIGFRRQITTDGQFVYLLRTDIAMPVIEVRDLSGALIGIYSVGLQPHERFRLLPLGSSQELLLWRDQGVLIEEPFPSGEAKAYLVRFPKGLGAKGKVGYVKELRWNSVPPIVDAYVSNDSIYLATLDTRIYALSRSLEVTGTFGLSVSIPDQAQLRSLFYKDLFRFGLASGVEYWTSSMTLAGDYVIRAGNWLDLIVVNLSKAPHSSYNTAQPVRTRIGLQGFRTDVYPEN